MLASPTSKCSSTLFSQHYVSAEPLGKQSTWRLKLFRLPSCSSQDISPDDLAESLPPHQPRYVVYSYVYKHDDGRVSYPLCFIFISPQGESPRWELIYVFITHLIFSLEVFPH